MLQVDTLGFPFPYFYEAVPAPKGLAEVLQTVHAMMQAPLATEPRLSDDEILEEWAHHPPACKCPRFPFPFTQLQSMEEADIARVVEQCRVFYEKEQLPRRIAQLEYVRAPCLAFGHA